MGKFLFLALALIYTQTFAKDLPDYLEICRRNDPQLDQCIERSLNDLQQYTRLGDVEKGIPKLEPIHIETLLDQKSTGPNKTSTFTVKNFNINGYSNYNVTNLRINIGSKLITFDAHVDSLRIDGEYDLNGRVDAIRVSNSGKITGYFSDVKTRVRLSYKIVKRNHKEYINVIHVGLNIKINGGNMILHDVFPSSKILAKQIQKSINSSFKTYTKDLTPQLQRELSKQLLHITNLFFSKYTYDQVLPRA
ncbi:circadian clock-controlled protein daywake-like [Arctopsyche grandis]|uniref:circadian clock-controlled protein daywake-like n=1 Tax=Arctopsyche grandis TaxID=121162 RepID=UPI00406D9D50